VTRVSDLLLLYHQPSLSSANSILQRFYSVTLTLLTKNCKISVYLGILKIKSVSKVIIRCTVGAIPSASNHIREKVWRR
jgi:hypothetical protein